LSCWLAAQLITLLIEKAWRHEVHMIHVVWTWIPWKISKVKCCMFSGWVFVFDSEAVIACKLSWFKNDIMTASFLITLIVMALINACHRFLLVIILVILYTCQVNFKWLKYYLSLLPFSRGGYVKGTPFADISVGTTVLLLAVLHKNVWLESKLLCRLSCWVIAYWIIAMWLIKWTDIHPEVKAAILWHLLVSILIGTGYSSCWLFLLVHSKWVDRRFTCLLLRKYLILYKWRLFFSDSC